MKNMKITTQKLQQKTKSFFALFVSSKTSNLFPPTSRSTRGFTILETIVAVLILSISITAIVVIAGGGAQKTIHIKDRLVAAYLAQEGVELVRNVRDSVFLAYEDDPTISARWNAFQSFMEPCFDAGCAVSFNYEGAFEGGIPVLVTPDVSEFLSFDEAQGVYEYGGDTETTFVRKVRLLETAGTDSPLRVEVTVEYREGTETRTYTTSEILFNWF